ncbi:DUF2306 domain-containing protein [Variovorax sp. PCZ-1]|uniref:DUF2306 domain-containing protein n=1 Tax=Variovorax sp. PCZ-1 TaxID=2835533 RepID=UPI001BCC852B|nr:DUF2306 domain-containing protein [Variovorax sp. PCZ-1]MBS7807786.1 DUF2306 domain-containing protein [Variovorax sp. PCZ-1]
MLLSFMRSFSSRSAMALWCLMTVFAIAIALFSAPPYVLPDKATSRIPLNPLFAQHMITLVVHAIPGCVALVLGPFQFSASLRQRYPGAHRFSGRIYLMCVLVSGVAAFPTAIMSTSGFIAQVGLLALAVTWLYSGYRAYASIRAGKIAEHRLWMVRNYALTFAAVPLRLFLGLGLAYNGVSSSDLSFADIYSTSVWASILVSHLIGEWFVAHPKPVV